MGAIFYAAFGVRGTVGFVKNRREAVFPKVDAASPRGLMAPPGLTALGAKGSVRDRLTPPGRVEGFRPRELYSIAALARWAPLWAPFFMPPLAAKTGQPSFARGKQANLAALELRQPPGLTALGWQGFYPGPAGSTLAPQARQPSGIPLPAVSDASKNSPKKGSF